MKKGDSELKKLQKMVRKIGRTYIDGDDLPFDEYETEWVDVTPIIERCVYCKAPWTPKMIKIYVEGGGACPTCHFCDKVLFIACDKCGKVVYRKEIESS